LTAACGIAICIPVVTIYRATHAEDSLVTEQPGEIVTYVQRALPRTAERPKVAVAPKVRSSIPNNESVERPLTRDSSSLTPVMAPLDLGDATTKSTDRTVAPAPGGIPFAASDRLSWVKTLSEAARDSMSLGLWSAGRFDFSTPLPPTAWQRDSARRENDRQASFAREDHRPMAVPLGNASVPFTFLSSGKSREERRRDSVVHADNLERLARLAARARNAIRSSPRICLPVRRRA
jgi:hypothetical protein